MLKLRSRGALIKYLRVGIKRACCEFQHRCSDSLVMYGRQVARLRFEESGFGSKQIGYGIQSCGKAVLRDAKTFLRFGHGRLCRFNSLLRGFQIRPCLTNLQADSRFHSSLLRRGTAGRSFALRYLRLVRASIEKVPAKANRNQPARASARRKSLAVGFEGSV